MKNILRLNRETKIYTILWKRSYRNSLLINIRKCTNVHFRSNSVYFPVNHVLPSIECLGRNLVGKSRWRDLDRTYLQIE